MNKRTIRLITCSAALAALAIVGSPGLVDAQEAEAEVPARTGPFGVGFQSAWPTWGLSGTYEVNERITAQAIVGAFGTLTNFGGRGIYRITQEEAYNVYGFGTVGVWRYGGVFDESSVGFGGGGGIELDWRRILASEAGSFPPLFGSIDIGFVVANFDRYNFSGFTIGSGLHYRF